MVVKLYEISTSSFAVPKISDYYSLSPYLIRSITLKKQRKRLHGCGARVFKFQALGMEMYCARDGLEDIFK